MTKKKYIDFGYEDIPEADKEQKVGEIFTKVAPKYDLMNDAMSFGMHRLWKRYFIKIANVQPGDDICDLASGSADIALLMAHKVVDGSITISDINAEMLQVGYDKMLDNGHAGKVKKVLAEGLFNFLEFLIELKKKEPALFYELLADYEEHPQGVQNMY